MKVKVKICGITSNKDLATAVEAGADAVGFVVNVPSSPRNLTPEKAEKMMKNTPVPVKNVVVAVPKSLSELIEVYKRLRPDILQIHGHNLLDSAIREKLANTCLIRAVQAKSDRVVEDAVKATNTFDAVLVDSFVSGKLGGTGRVHDWELSRRVKQLIHPKPLILAGGLNPENVRDAVRAVQPYAVDVSTGVESRPGVKDPEKVFAFIRNAKEVEV
ncbi:MAG: phosphoribosylanthranilate isomerase [Candidatus Bathyarchaeota archaeon]|nr:phosphoribosylanthranilate isomerase [Candidatus Bathyarchaeota archaeon]MDH5532226.1 phosphoribosylanthranilate isomerase [Candidatus Bathyarchaeota archaeon]